MAATAKDVVKIAAAQVGTRESPANSNRVKYSLWYPMPGQPWCAMFISWVFHQAEGAPLMPKFAYTPWGADWFRGQKRGFTDERRIRPGDVLFFNFPDSLDRIQHVGFAEHAWEGGAVRTIEGNTSSGSGGSQDNGGGVFRRIRRAPELVYVGRPAYGKAQTKLPRFSLPKARTYLQAGDRGADVRTLQTDLNRWMRAQRRLARERKQKLSWDWGTIDVEGRFGAETKRAVVSFQRATRLDADGKVGRHTIAVLERERRRLWGLIREEDSSAR